MQVYSVYVETYRSLHNPRKMVFGTSSNTFRNVVNKDIMNECSLMMLVLLFGDCIGINIE